MTKSDRRHKMAPIGLSRAYDAYLRGTRPPVVSSTEPTVCALCGRRALYRTNAGNEGRCRAHREVK